MRAAIENVYFIGLGAIGLKYAARLHDANPSLVKIIAGAQRVERFRSNPPSVNGKTYAFEFVGPGDETLAPDLIVVAVKSKQLERALGDIQSFIGDNTSVISLMNGIMSEEIIGRKIGHDRLIYANVYMDAVREGNAVTYRDIGRIVFGERNNATKSDRVMAIEQLFGKAGIPCAVPEDMLRAQWAKFMLNVGINQASAVLRAPYGTFQSNSHARALMIAAAEEVVRISEHAGISLDQSDIDDFVRIIDSLDPMGKTSMLQDVEAGRTTEVDTFAGTVIDLGFQYGVPTPVNQTLLNIIKTIEHADGR